MTDITTPNETETSSPEDKPRLDLNYYKLLAASAVSNTGDGVAQIAYPWLASAVTRNPILIALVLLAQRVPWLIFTLPAGVITDRHDRQRLMTSANVIRTLLTAVVAWVVLGRQGTLPSPEELATSGGSADTDYVLYGLVVAATVLLGLAEVLYDNAGQTFTPSVVPTPLLEKANGRMWSTEMAMNNFIGPPLGALLLASAFALPFIFDAVTFAVSAALIATISVSAKTAATPTDAVDRPSWKVELVEGFQWLWRHELLRPLAIILGLINALVTMSGAILVLFAQEVLNTSATEFALLGTGGAVGGIIGGWTASRISERLGSGTALLVTIGNSVITSLITGLSSWWPLVWLMTAQFMLMVMVWNVITVSLRQTIIPDNLLGRVNSVYRFFAWGMMPVGAFLGGVVVSVGESVVSRETALRLPWFASAAGFVALLIFALPRLTTERLERARAAAGG